MRLSNDLPKNSLGLVCLNAGCGGHYLKDWINLDFQSSEYVQYYDLRKGIPYPDNTFDVAYSSNIIEHFSYKMGWEFIKELFRVLKHGGVIRLLTPDLERIVKEYLNNLDAWAKDKSVVKRQRYEWIVMEMFDQMTREKSGGLMLEKIQSGDVLPEYVIYRTGDELRNSLQPKHEKFVPKYKSRIKMAFLKRTIASCKNRLLNLIFCKKEIPFGKSSELHKWYYDRVSLEYLFGQVGFVNFKVVDYKTSRIPGWEKINLDISDFGDNPRKPDSIVVEASKPR